MNNRISGTPVAVSSEWPRASTRVTRAVAEFYEAILDPSLWPKALATLAAAIGALGTCCVVEDKRYQHVEWMVISYPCAELASDYMARYAQLDPYRPLLAKAPVGLLLPLSQSVSKETLENSEWYNDLLVKNGVTDVLGVKLFENRSQAVMFGAHMGRGQARHSPRNDHRWQFLTDALGTAAHVLVQLRSSSLLPSAAVQALNQLSAAVLVVDSDQRVLELNDAAERITRSGDGLLVRDGQLLARRSIDQGRLAAAIRAATDKREPRVAREGILVARLKGRPSYVVTVTPLNTNPRDPGVPLAMILVVNPEWRIPSLDAVARAFGLSPAESRLAIALVQGHRINEIASTFGVEITTIRTQLSSILRKVGVERQTDLIRVLGSVDIFSTPS